MIIRKFTGRDTEKVIEIWYEASLQNHSFIPLELMMKQREEVITKYLPAAESYVVEDDGEILGFISMLDKYIGGLFVSPKHQRKKIGSLLVEKIKSEKGSLAVGVYEKNSRGRLFYEKIGFRYVSNDVDPETNENVLNMVLNA